MPPSATANLVGGDLLVNDIGGRPHVLDSCKDCKISLLDHAATVTIDDCAGCQIIVGPSSTVFVRDCKECTFHIVAGELRAVGCVSCKFYVWCSTSPIIDSCRGLGFGEWHVAYPGLAAQYQLAGLDPLATNLSRDVRDSTDGDMAAVDSGRVWTLLPPQPELSVDPGTCTSVAPPAAAATGVDADATATKTEDTTADAETEATQFYSVVYSGVVAVRDAPQRDAEEVGERLPGEVVEVAEVIESGWVRLQPPPGYTGTDRYMCIEQAGTTLLTPVPASQVPASARGSTTAARKRRGAGDDGGNTVGALCSGRTAALFCGLALLVIFLAAQLIADGAIRTIWPPPAFSYADIPDQSGKRVLVTGATTGIGKVMAIELARRGAHVFVGARTEAQGIEATAQIVSASGANPSFVEPITIDLASLVSVQAAASMISGADAPLHTLILNAGVMAPPFALTQDGHEMQFGVNHLGHFALVTALLDKLKASAPARIVTVSSKAHQWTYTGGIRSLFTEHFAAAIDSEEEYDPWAAYGQSKLCNLLMNLELSRRLASTKVYVNAAHPGFVATELQRHHATLLALPTALLALAPSDGALTPLFLATAKEVERKDIRGKYYVPIAAPAEPSELATDPAMATKLWQQSEQMVLAVLGEKDPDRFFVGKKSKLAAADGRRAKVKKTETPPSSSAQGCTEKEECSDPAAAATGSGRTIDGGEKGPQCSKIVDGPGGVKWEVFEPCSEPEAAASKPKPADLSPPKTARKRSRPKSKIIQGPGGAKWEIFQNADGTWPNTQHP